MKSLRSKATVAVLWSSLEKIVTTLGQFIIGIILANLLDPGDFGLLGMLAIFIAVSKSLVDSGMESGLIQKDNPSAIDFSTVFIFNLIVSLGLYALLFFTAPWVAVFYEEPELDLLLKTVSLLLIISSFTIVQRAQLTIDINFKTIAKIRVISIIFGGIVAIVFAKYGFGVWSLVVQMLLSELISAFLFWVKGNWKFSFQFSKASFKDLFGYGSKLMLSGLYSQILMNMYSVFIGKGYNDVQLGYYTNGKKYSEFASASITAVLQQVTFPIFSKLQDEKEKLFSLYRKVFRLTSFIIIPVITLLFILAEPIVDVLFHEKWQPIIPLIQIFCFAVVFYPLSMVSLNLLKAIGRSDLYLKINLIKAPFHLIILLATISIGIEAVIIGNAITSFISFCINTYYPGKYFSFGLLDHLKNLLPFLFASLTMGTIVYFGIYFIENNILKLAVASILSMLSYLILTKLLKFEELEEVKLLVNSIILKRK